MLAAERIAGVVVHVQRSVETELPLIFDDEILTDFYSSQEISSDIYIQLAGSDAWYRFIRDTSICYNA